MDMVSEPSRDIPVVHECDLCVVGGSCTGVFAAVRAARLGARVAIIEDNGFFGGVATASLVNVWHFVYDMTGARQIIAGLTTETVDRLRRRNAVTERPFSTNLSWQYAFNSHELTVELDELVREAGIRPFLHTRFCRPVLEEGVVTAAIVEDKSGRRAIRARVFIDATGDGDLVARAGLPTRTPAVLQPPTMTALLQGFAAVNAADPGFNFNTAIFDERYPEALSRGFSWGAGFPGLEDIQMQASTRVFGADCSDADQLTDAAIEGRRQVRSYCDLVRRHVPGGERFGLAGLPAKIGIRETRHAVCLHTFTESELLRGAPFDDAIGYGTYRVDVHHADKPGLTFRWLDGREEYVAPGRERVRGRWLPEGKTAAPFYQIPYRSLVPRGSTNVLVAGRLIDADEGAFGGVRVMVNCNQMGEAAGVAAWLAFRDGVGVAEVAPAEIRRRLAEGGSAQID